ncbi:Sortilin [Cichlidogyrus casuarinus]|uniref:Sortilin n=1 Tax=Cichlidogyrus casuarinus TaxID=1844966 RepID=A0ABD2QN30_9PLAT
MHVSQRERLSMSFGPEIKYSTSKIKRRGGILLISDSTGRVFRTSLHDHVPFADVFPIVSSRGTYITSYYQSGGSLDGLTEISTVISFDRGSTWSTLNLPDGVDPKEACKRREPDEYLQAMTQILGTFGDFEPLLNLGQEKSKEDEEKPCSLQLMVPFHVDRKKNGVGSFFEADEFHSMAVPSAPGLVLTVGRIGAFAHGRMNTYLSRNGGRSWKKASLILLYDK